MIAETSISMADAMKQITINVTITRRKEWAIRIWAAILLMKFGAFVLGCPIKVDVVTETPNK